MASAAAASQLTVLAAAAARIAHKRANFTEDLVSASAAAVAGEAAAGAAAAAAAPSATSPAATAELVRSLQFRLAAATEAAKRRGLEIARLEGENGEQRGRLSSLAERMRNAEGAIAAADREISQLQAGAAEAPALEAPGRAPNAAAEQGAERAESPPRRQNSGFFQVCVQNLPSSFTRAQIGAWICRTVDVRPAFVQTLRPLADSRQRVLLSYRVRAEAVRALPQLHNCAFLDDPVLTQACFRA